MRDNVSPNGMPVSYWRCSACGRERIQLADCQDMEAMVRSVLDENLRRTGANVEYDDALSRLHEEAWDLWGRWDNTKGVPFLAYAVGLLRLRSANFYRDELGRDGKKAHAHALSLDAPANEDGATWKELLEEGSSDPAETLSPDLLSVLR